MLLLASSCAASLITSLETEADWTAPLSSLQVTCTASDRDGDDLKYEWSSDGGDISGTGAVVNWTAPGEVGIYHVTVVVTDAHGEEDTRSVILSTATGTPPVIEDLIVTAEHKYLRESTAGGDYDVWKAREYDIECIASGTSVGVVYDWSCDDGEISGEGSLITWTAPNKASVEATVTVVVSDVDDNSVAKNIVFTVPSCTCGSWG